MCKALKIVTIGLLVLFAFSANEGFAQAQKKKPKSLREHERKFNRSRDSLLRSFSKNDTSISTLLRSLGQYTNTFNQINNSLAEGLDTTDVSQKLPRVAKRLNRVRTLANTKKSSTLRYLFVLRDNLDHIQEQLDGWQDDLDDVNTKLVQNQHDILRFANDSLLRTIPEDSLLRRTYFSHLREVRRLWRKTDSTNRGDLFKVNLLQDKVATAYTNILDETDQIDSKIKRFANRAVDGEFDFIGQPNRQYNGLDSALNSTVDLTNTQTYYFLRSNTSSHLTGLALLIFVFGWLFYNKTRAAKYNENPELIFDKPNYIYTSPVVSTLLMVTTIMPYLYDHPPVFCAEISFVLSTIFVLLMVRKRYPSSLFNFLFLLFWLTLIYAMSNVLIQITSFDRYLNFFLNLAAIAIAFVFYRKVKKAPEGHLPKAQFILVIFIVLQFISLLLNITGRFSLAKIIGITSVFNLWMLIALYFIVNIILQGLYLQFHSKKDKHNLAGWIDYNILQNKFRGILDTLAGLLWLFFLLQNLNIDDWLHDYLGDVLNQSRSIGGASFTFGGFAIFIAVIWLSSLVSRIISYFYDVSAQQATDLSVLKKKNRASTLLIRIGVFSIGFLLAVAASGFPLDKLTIIFSAFGVGIGFGLQNIVNNLVSGMILAFEKPIQIGDIIEVNNRSGTVKEIGIRSSKLATSDGSEVIIPNGDLISQNVVNWTLSNTNRRIELMVSAAQGSDIPKVKALLTDLLCNRDDIMSSPGPSVFLNGITDKSIDFMVYFWAADIANTHELRSRILNDIYDAFTKAGISMPKG